MLSYRGDPAHGEADAPTYPPGPLGPALSVVPGLICWVLFASAAMPRELPILERLADLFGGRATNIVIIVAWLIAIATSLVTLAVYARRPRAWHTTICLSVHLAGLLFSTLLLGGLAVLLVA
jgi:hypothetical protein